MDSLINFRDFGGVAGVRPGRLYRCGHLGALSPEAAAHLAGLDFTTVADLRYAGERSAQPSPWPGEWIGRVLFHGENRNADAPHLAMLRQGTLTVEGVDLFYDGLYRELPFAPAYRSLFGAILRRMAAAPGRTLVHCTAGKDRTGIFCALLLSLLGVRREAILADYLRSRGAPGLKAMVPGIIARARTRYGHALDRAAVEALVGVKPGYLMAMFEALETREGSVEGYFRSSGIGDTELHALRAQLLA